MKSMARVAPVLLAALLACLLYFPLGIAKFYSMNGSFMHIVYPWVGVTAPDQRVRGMTLHQTDYSEEYYPTIVENTKELRHGMLPLWFSYGLAGVPNLNLAITEYTHPLR